MERYWKEFKPEELQNESLKERVNEAYLKENFNPFGELTYSTSFSHKQNSLEINTIKFK